MINKLPLKYNFFTPTIIKKVISANKALAELNGVCQKIPNQNILINALALQEAKDSSEIENIITTHDDLYKAITDKKYFSKETKEVENYKEALLPSFNKTKKDKIITTRDIQNIQESLIKNNAGFRTQTGTSLKNAQSGEVIYTPPQDIGEIVSLMDNLEKYINENLDDNDPLIKMAIIHYQFESIHPFYDGNGRTGRIINILYLTLNNLLDLPILYLSSYILKNKADYYRLLQEVREKGNWDEWVLYMLDSIEQTSGETIKMIHDISSLMVSYKYKMREQLPNIYSKDLLEIIFSHPYTKIDFLTEGMKITRQTASSYLNQLVEAGYFQEVQRGVTKYFINQELYELLKKGI